MAAVVEPVHLLEGRLFDGPEAALRSAAVNDLCLEQAADRFGLRVVVTVAK